MKIQISRARGEEAVGAQGNDREQAVGRADYVQCSAVQPPVPGCRQGSQSRPQDGCQSAKIRALRRCDVGPRVPLDGDAARFSKAVPGSSGMGCSY